MCEKGSKLSSGSCVPCGNTYIKYIIKQTEKNETVPYTTKCSTDTYTTGFTCPIDYPIYKKDENACVLEDCTDDTVCIKSNSIIKTQYLNGKIILTGLLTYFFNYAFSSNNDFIIAYLENRYDG